VKLRADRDSAAHGDTRVFVGELELSASAEERRPGSRYDAANVLIRLHGEPLGLVRVPLTDGQLVHADVVGRAWAEHADRIRTHLARDGFASTSDPRELGDVAARCHDQRKEVQRAGPMVSVVVPTRDRPEMVVDCLASILRQDYPRVEVVVVDNAPHSSATVDAVQSRFGADPRVRYIREDRAGISFARNRGVAAAQGPIVAFTDDDVRVDEGWLTALVRPFLADPETACATGLVMPARLDTQAQVWTEEFGGFNKGYDARTWALDSHDDDILFPYAAGRLGSGQNMAFDTAFLRRSGGFNIALGIGSPAMGGEDLAAFFSVVTSGRRLAYAPDAVVWHIHRRDMRSLRRQLFTYGVGLSAYLTSCLVEHPQRLLDLLPRVPAGVRHLLSPRSGKNVHKSRAYPKHLTLLELVGLLYGPIAYGRGLLRTRRLRHAPPLAPPSGGGS
jgi:GT2 family glycosyltransferase